MLTTRTNNTAFCGGNRFASLTHVYLNSNKTFLLECWQWVQRCGVCLFKSVEVDARKQKATIDFLLPFSIQREGPAAAAACARSQEKMKKSEWVSHFHCSLYCKRLQHQKRSPALWIYAAACVLHLTLYTRAHAAAGYYPTWTWQRRRCVHTHTADYYPSRVRKVIVVVG